MKMTVKRAKDIWHHQTAHDIYQRRQKNAAASAYFSAAIIALMFAIVVLLIGAAVLSDSVESFFDEKQVINIVLPADDTLRR